MSGEEPTQEKLNALGEYLTMALKSPELPAFDNFKVFFAGYTSTITTAVCQSVIMLYLRTQLENHYADDPEAQGYITTIWRAAFGVAAAIAATVSTYAAIRGQKDMAELKKAIAATDKAKALLFSGADAAQNLTGGKRSQLRLTGGTAQSINPLAELAKHAGKEVGAEVTLEECLAFIESLKVTPVPSPVRVTEITTGVDERTPLIRPPGTQ